MNIDSTIHTFAEHINSRNGLFLPQRFIMKIPRPTNIGSSVYNASASVTERDLQFMCTTTSIPGRTLSTGEIAAPGPEVKYPYQDAYEDLECTFLCTNNSKRETNNTTFNDSGSYKGLPEKRFFDAWMNSVVNQNNMLIGYRDNYTSELSLTIFDRGNNQVGSYSFNNCYPLAVSDIELSHNSEEPATFTVTFNVDRWQYSN